MDILLAISVIIGGIIGMFLVGMLPIVLVFWLIATVGDLLDLGSKRKLQHSLALLNSSEFDSRLSYIRKGLCIAVDQNRKKFAIGTLGRIVVLTNKDLVEINIIEDSKASFDSYLRLQVSVKDSVRAYYEFGARSGRDQALREIYAQLKSMKIGDAEPGRPSSEGDW